MKRIGILTWFFGINYGARAHSLALKKIVESLGYECEFINFTSCNNWKVELHTCCMAGNLKRHPIILMKGICKWVKFNKQLSVYPRSKKVLTAKEIEMLGYDAIIIGSDEILNLNHDLANKLYYGVGFCKEFPMMMYATSAGTISPDTILDDELQEGLRNIRFLSVRDNTSQMLLQNNSGKDVKIVLDPTLLYEFEKVKKRLYDEDYLLIYSFGSLTKERNRIVEFAKSERLKVVCVGRKCDWADKSFQVSDLDEWLSLYEHASYVVTDSYHGLIFAIKYHKDFVLVARGDKTNKVDGLRNVLKITRGSLKPEEKIEDYLSVPVDYPSVDEAIKKERTNSLGYLKNGLEIVTRET